MNEVWFDLLDYENYYQISDLGRIRSKSRYVSGRNNSKILKHSRVLKIRVHSGGYCYVQLNIDSKEKNITLHRYIAKHFIPNPDNKPYINHINGNKLDNRVENLEWVTHSENMIHAFKTGLECGRKGTKHHNCKLSEVDVINIRCRIKNGELEKNLANEYNVHQVTINSIKLNKIWKHI